MGEISAIKSKLKPEKAKSWNIKKFLHEFQSNGEVQISEVDFIEH